MLGSHNNIIIAFKKNNLPMEDFHQNLTAKEANQKKKLLRLQGIKAALFDMDGTMINNITYHRKAWDEFIKQFGISITYKDFKSKTSGKLNKEIIPSILGMELDDKKIKQLIDEKERIYRKLYAPHVKAIEGLYTLIYQLKAKQIKIAITTTAVKENRQFILKALGLTNVFEAIVGEEHFTKGKPDPDIFLTGAKKLGVEPKQCIVFDDVPLGIEAARRAGMKSIGLLTSHTESELKDANIIIEDFSQLDIED